MVIKNKVAADGLKAHPKGANQHIQHCVMDTRDGITMASQQCLVLNALVCADSDTLNGLMYSF